MNNLKKIALSILILSLTITTYAANYSIGADLPTIEILEWINTPNDASNVPETLSAETLKEDIIIIEFFVTWCSPCHKMIQKLEKFENKYKGRVKTLVLTNEKIEVLSTYMKKTENKERPLNNMFFGRINHSKEEGNILNINYYPVYIAFRKIKNRYELYWDSRFSIESKYGEFYETTIALLDSQKKIPINVFKTKEEHKKANKKYQLLADKVFKQYKEIKNYPINEKKKIISLMDSYIKIGREWIDNGNNHDEALGIVISGHTKKLKVCIDETECESFRVALLEDMKKLKNKEQISATVLNNQAWGKLVSKGFDRQFPEAALEISKLAVKRSNSNDSLSLDTLARAYFFMADIDNAIKYQKKAIVVLGKLCDEYKSNSDIMQKQLLIKVLKFYEKFKNNLSIQK